MGFVSAGFVAGESLEGLLPEDPLPLDWLPPDGLLLLLLDGVSLGWLLLDWLPLDGFSLQEEIKTQGKNGAASHYHGQPLPLGPKFFQCIRSPFSLTPFA